MKTMSWTLFLTSGMMLLTSNSVPAQSPGLRTSGFTGGYGPGMENLYRDTGAGYLPSGGGFVPYTPGPGGGLGVQARSGGGSSPASPGGMSMPGSSTQGGPGRAGAGLSPLAPIGGMGARRGGTGSSLFMNPAAARGMGRSTRRPPVGSYPFRIPPSLLGPSARGPAMAM